LGPRPGNMSQNDPKTTLLVTSVTKYISYTGSQSVNKVTPQTFK